MPEADLHGQRAATTQPRRLICATRRPTGRDGRTDRTICAPRRGRCSGCAGIRFLPGSAGRRPPRRDPAFLRIGSSALVEISARRRCSLGPGHSNRRPGLQLLDSVGAETASRVGPREWRTSDGFVCGPTESGHRKACAESGIRRKDDRPQRDSAAHLLRLCSRRRRESVKFERTRKDTLGWPHRLRVQHVRRRRRFSDDARCHELYAVGRPALFRTIVPMPEWERIAGNPASAACRAPRRLDGAHSKL